MENSTHNFQGSCPVCGYCPHCGRGGNPYPVYPVYPNPYYPSTPTYPDYPWYSPQPYITWTTTGSCTCGPNQYCSNCVNKGGNGEDRG